MFGRKDQPSKEEWLEEGQESSGVVRREFVGIPPSFPAPASLIMMTAMEGETFSPEHLLEHAGWLDALARSLVGDVAQAEDAVQETWLSLLSRPTRTISRALLSKVLRHRISDRRRQEHARRERELRAAHSATSSVTPGQLLERIEAHRQLVGFVLELDEPYRSAVVLRYFEELSAAEIAEREGLPATTVRTRLNRAKELLKRRLDRAYGARKVWCSALLPLLALRSASAGAPGTPVASSAGRAAATVVPSSAGKTASAALTTVSLGGIVMAQKTALATGAVALVTLALGVGIGRMMVPREGRGLEGEGQFVSVEQHDELQRRYDTMVEHLRTSKSKVDALETRNRHLREQLLALRQETKERSESDAVAEEGSRQPVDSPVNWSALATLIGENFMLLEEAAAFERDGMPVPEDLKKKLGIFYGQVMTHEMPLRLSSKFPFLDKTTYDRLVRATLEESLELSGDQLKKLSELNETFFHEAAGDVDPAELLPVERYALTHDLMLRNRESIREILENGQLESWDLLARVFDDVVAQSLTGMTPVKEYGLGNPDIVDQLLADWKRDFSLKPPQVEALTASASDYVERAKSLLEQFGRRDAAEALPPELEARLHSRLLELQQRTERNILPRLSVEQQDALRERTTTLRRFSYRRGDPSVSYVR